MAATTNYQSIDTGPDHTIRAFNTAALRYQEAWIDVESDRGQTRFTVLSSVSGLFGSVSKDLLERVTRATLTFLQHYEGELDPSVPSHKKMLLHMEASFSKPPLPINTVAVMDQLVKILSGGASKGRELAHDSKTVMQIYQSAFPKDRLCYTDKDYLLCNFVLLIGKEELPVPACQAKLFGRSKKWDEQLLPILRSEGTRSPIITLPDCSPDRFLTLMNLIHSDDDRYYPKDAKGLLELSVVASQMLEEKVLEVCTVKLQSMIPELSSDDLFKQCRGIDVDSLSSDVRGSVLSLTATVLWTKDPANLSEREMRFLLQQSESPIPELEILDFLEKWEAAHLSAGQRTGDLIAPADTSGSRLIDLIRFETMDPDSFINKVFTKAYLSFEDRVLWMQRLQKATHEHSEVDLGDWEPRPCRNPIVQVERNYGGNSKRAKLSVKLPIPPKYRQLTNENRTSLVTSFPFELFDAQWEVSFQEHKQDGYGTYHAAFLRLMSFPTSACIKCAIELSISGNSHHYTARGTVDYKTTSGFGTPVKEGLTVSNYLEDGCITFTANITNKNP